MGIQRTNKKKKMHIKELLLKSVNGVFQSEPLSVFSERAVHCEGSSRERGEDSETEEQREAETRGDRDMKNSSLPQQ